MYLYPFGLLLVILIIHTRCSDADSVSAIPAIVGELHEQLVSQLMNDFFYRTIIQEMSWLRHTDSKSRQIFNTNRERYISRMATLGIHVNPSGSSKYFAVNFTAPMAGNDTANINLFDLVYQAENLFNSYDNYESGIVAMFALFELSAPTSFPLSDHALQSIKSCVWLLSQTEWERGYVDNARIYMNVLFAIIRSDVGDIAFSPDIEVAIVASLEMSKYILFRLRYILSVPRMPVASEVATEDREMEMYPAIRAWIQEFAGYNVPLQYFSVGAATVFYLSHQGINERRVQELVAEGYGELSPEIKYIASGLPVPTAWGLPMDPKPPLEPTERRTKCLRVGFISAWFYEQSIGKLLFETIRELALLQYQSLDAGTDTDTDYTIELVMYYIDQRSERAPDGMPVKRSDRYTAVYEGLFVPDSHGGGGNSPPRQGICAGKPFIAERFVRIVNTAGGPLDSEHVLAVHELLGAHELDVLIFGEIGMDFLSYLLSFGRVAGVQAAWWGHPITTGNGDTIDYYISLDAELDAAADDDYVEQLVRMEFINTLHSPLPSPLGSENNESPDILKVIAEVANLPSVAVQNPKPTNPVHIKYSLVLGATYKMHPEFLKVVAELLVETQADSVVTPMFVIFIAERGSVEFNEHVLQQIRISLENATVVSVDTPILSLLRRVQFHSYDSYFELLTHASVILDTFPYGGCLTVHDALSHGVPIVTYPQQYVRGRFTLAMYQQMNMSKYITSNTAEYVNVVLRILRRNEKEVQVYREEILHAFHFHSLQPGSGYLHQNHKVAKEWLGFLVKAWRYQYEL